MSLPDCPFCDIDKIQAPYVEHLLSSDFTEHLVFEPLNPVAPGHMLVVPRVHVEHAAVDPGVTAMAAEIAARVAVRYPSANIVTSIGAPATQTVEHLHFHVVPRRQGDGLHLPWTVPTDHTKGDHHGTA